MWKTWWWYLLLLIGMIYLAIFYNSYMILIATILMLILPFISFILAYISSKKISISFESETKIVKKNEPFTVVLYFINRFILPVTKIRIHIVYANHFAKEEQGGNYYISLKGNGSQKVCCELCSDYSGNMEFSISSVKIYDFLSLWSFKIPENHSIHVSVLPEMIEIMENMLRTGFESILEEEEYSTKRSGDDPSEIFRIKEYQSGDKLNRIHWKLSAKEGNLMVKDFGLPLDSSVVILLELYSSGENTESFLDAEIEIVVALSIQFIRMKQHHFITWYDSLTESLIRKRITNEDDLYEALALLFEAGLYQEIYQGLAMYQGRYYTEQYTNLFYITSSLQNKEVYRVREFAKHANCHVTVVLKEDKLSEDEIKSFIETEVAYSVVYPNTLNEDIMNMKLQT